MIETLWPDTDPGAAINSLNQTVFQLRRMMEPGRDSDAPRYIDSSAELIRLNPELVDTDLLEFRRLAEEVQSPNDAETRTRIARRLVSLVRGEFLSDLKYEDWVAGAQMRVHLDVRAALLPIAEGRITAPRDDTAIMAGQVLTLLDPYDEAVHLAVARHFANTGRRQQARELLRKFMDRLRVEFGEAPSEDLQVAASLLGLSVKY